MEELMGKLYEMYRDALGTADGDMLKHGGAGHAYLRSDVCGVVLEVCVMWCKVTFCITKGESVFVRHVDRVFDEPGVIRSRVEMMVEEALAEA